MSVSDAVWHSAILPKDASIKDAIGNLNQTALQIILVTDERNTFLGTVTDGDIRRALLRGIALDDGIESIMRQGSLVVDPTVERKVVQQLMYNNRVRQVPIVDTSKTLVGLHLWDDVNLPQSRPNTVVVMAGGLGTRLRPLTDNCPKPMLPIAGKPMLEHIIEQAKKAGFSRIVLAVNYLGHMVEDYFQSGERFGVEIRYLRERLPLGTAGALALLDPKPTLPFIVTNGDVLSDVNYGELLDFHVNHSAIGTMAVRRHEWRHPFGVVQTTGIDITAIDEKPTMRTNVNAGIYVFAPEVLSVIPSNEVFDMPAVFQSLISGGRRTIAFPLHEQWLDVGRPEDLRSLHDSSAKAQ